MSKTNVVVVQEMSCEPEKAFDVWLKPEMVKKWFGPGLGEVTKALMSPCKGGSFVIIQDRRGMELEHGGVYTDFQRPNRLAFTWGVPKHSQETSHVVVEIQPKASGCEVTLTHELLPHWENYASKVQDSWSKMLQEMKKLLR